MMWAVPLARKASYNARGQPESSPNKIPVSRTGLRGPGKLGDDPGGFFRSENNHEKPVFRLPFHQSDLWVLEGGEYAAVGQVITVREILVLFGVLGFSGQFQPVAVLPGRVRVSLTTSWPCTAGKVVVYI